MRRITLFVVLSLVLSVSACSYVAGPAQRGQASQPILDRPETERTEVSEAPLPASPDEPDQGEERLRMDSPGEEHDEDLRADSPGKELEQGEEGGLAEASGEEHEEE